MARDRLPTYRVDGGYQDPSGRQFMYPGMGGNNAGMGYDPYTRVGVGSMAPRRGTASGYDDDGNWVGTQNAGSRDIGDVNWGGFAGIQNWLQNAPAGQRSQREQYLERMGMMPSYNGVPLGQALQQQQNFFNPTGMPSDDPRNGSREVGAQWYGPSADRTSSATPMSSGAPGGPFAGLANAFRPSGGFSLGSKPGVGGLGGGPMGLPLEGKVQSKIGGLLDNPSPLTAEQTSIARNRFMGGLSDEQAEASKNVQMDAVRRGVNPGEVAGNQHAIEGQFRNARLQASNDFDFQNAMTSRQGLLAGIGAAGGLLSTQAANEDSIRKYLAMMGAAQAGQQPNFSMWG